MTLNVNGLRQEDKILLLGSFLVETRVGILILTETHLTKDEARTIRIPSYYVANECSLIPDRSQMRGGVVILAHKDIVTEELSNSDNQESEVEFPLYGCSVLAYLHDDNLGCIKVTGVYFPPKEAKTLAQVARITDSTGC